MLTAEASRKIKIGEIVQITVDISEDADEKSLIDVIFALRSIEPKVVQNIRIRHSMRWCDLWIETNEPKRMKIVEILEKSSIRFEEKIILNAR